MSDLTPETLAELRRLREAATPDVAECDLDAAAIAARNEFYGADRGPEATSEWRWVVVAALNAIKAARPGGTVAEAVPARRESPDVAELRDQIAATIHRRICEHSREDCIENLGNCERATDSAMPLISTALDEGNVLARLLADALKDAIRTLRELAEKAAGEPIPFDDFDLYAEVVDGALDAAAERDALAAKVERLTGELVDAGYRQGEDRAERDALRSMLAGRCLSGITHRDEEHRQSVCMLPEGHAPLMHDDCMGCTWTDADHWEPSAIDALAAKVARVRALVDWHETKADKARRFRIEINGQNPVMDKAAAVHADASRRLRAALDGGES